MTIGGIEFMKDHNRPWSFKHKEIKAYINKIWKENRHLNNRTQVLLKICKEHGSYPQLKEENKQLKNTIRQSGSSPDFSNEIASQREISQERCEWDIDFNEKRVCTNPNAPIDAYLKRDLNLQICMICRKLMKKQLEENKLIDQEKIRRFHEQTKKNIHSLAKRLNETIEQEQAPHRKNCAVCGQRAIYQFFNKGQSMFLCESHKNRHGFQQFGIRRL